MLRLCGLQAADSGETSPHFRGEKQCNESGIQTLYLLCAAGIFKLENTEMNIK